MWAVSINQVLIKSLLQIVSLVAISMTMQRSTQFGRTSYLFGYHPAGHWTAHSRIKPVKLVPFSNCHNQRLFQSLTSGRVTKKEQGTQDQKSFLKGFEYEQLSTLHYSLYGLYQWRQIFITKLFVGMKLEQKRPRKQILRL